jgi:type II secretory pathway component PulK
VILRQTGGYVLLAVLWILTGVSALALSASLAAREIVDAARNRVDLTHAEWLGEECLARVRATVHEIHASSARKPQDQSLLATIDLNGARLMGTLCEVTITPTGAAIDLNQADEEMLRRLLTAAGVSLAQADSMAAAVADWRDRDVLSRPTGAERSWYASRGLLGPRNGPLADVRELSGVRGFESLTSLHRLFNVEASRISINDAPPAVLLALPGLTEETVAQIMARRIQGERIREISELEIGLSHFSRDALHRGFNELARLASPESEAAILTIRTSRGVPPVTAVLEVRLTQVGEHVAVTRRRTWVE